MRLFQYTLIVFFLTCCLAGCTYERNYLESFAKLSEVHRKWLEITSIPDAAHMLRYAPYIYHSKFSSEEPLNISEILLYEGITQNVMNSPSRSLSAKNSKCSEDLVHIISHLNAEWALKILDSDGKLGTGILNGGFLWPGDYKECISVHSPSEQGNFHGKYCIASWALDLPSKKLKLPITTGFCVPDSCTAKQMKHGGNATLQIIDRFPLLKQYSSLLSMKNVVCKNEEKKLDGPSIAFLSVVSILGLLVLLGSLITVYNYFKHEVQNKKVHNIPEETFLENSFHSDREQNAFSIDRDQTICKEKSRITTCNEVPSGDKTYLTEKLESQISSNKQIQFCHSSGIAVVKNILLCFCAFTNGAKILNMNAGENQMLCINGIRFLSLTWVILGHTYISSVAMISNQLDVINDIDNFPFQAVLQSPFSVDSFFLLSGFLLTYLFLREATKKEGKVNWIYFYVHRFWRLTPAYMIVVGFYMTVFKYLGSGPFWDENQGESCQHTWWWYLLYINNFIPINEMCVGWSWYLANDMQFYIMSPIFLYALWRWPKIGLGIVASLLLGSWSITGVFSYKYDLIPMFVGVTKVTDFNAYEEKMWYSFDMIYDKPYCRIGPYLVGVILGYILHKTSDRKKFMKMWQQALGWILAAFCSISVVYGLYHSEISKLTGVFYNALCRSVFSIGLAWVIFVCHTGHGGLINHLLSLKLWIPLSRLTYCAYLVHPALIHGYYQGLQTALFFTQTVMITNFMGFLLMAYGLAFVTSIAFESPMMNLEKLIIKKRS